MKRWWWLVAALVLFGACGRSGGEKVSVGERRLAGWLQRARGERITATDTGFVATVGEAPTRGRGVIRLTRELVVELPREADGAMVVSSVMMRRRGVDGTPARLQRGVVAHDGEHVDVFTYVDGDALEELLVVPGPGAMLGYDLALPAGWRLSRVADHTVEVRDADGHAQLRVAANAAWDAEGSAVAVTMTVDDAGLRIELGDVTAWPVVVDPTFIDATVPLKLREAHTATLLLDGQVLITGGLVGEVPDGSAELFDTASGTTTVIEGMTTPRAHHTATPLYDGRVLITGGEDENDALASTELFDPATRTFGPGPDMAAARALHMATRLEDGRVLIVGVDGADIFDPDGDTMTATGPTPATFSPAAAALMESGSVFVIGLHGTIGPSHTIYDPALGTFSAAAAGPTAFEPGGFVGSKSASITRLEDGRLLMLGGCPCGIGGGTGIHASDVVEIYDPVSGLSTATILSRERFGHSSTLLPDGRLVLAGSGDYEDADEQQSAAVFDPGTGLFTDLGVSMVARHQQHTATALPNGSVLVFGGQQAVAELLTVGARGSFAQVGDTLLGRKQHEMTTLLTGEVLVTGTGWTALFGPPESDEAELFDPVTNTFATTATMPAPRTDHTAILLRNGDVLLAGGAGPVDTAIVYNRAAETFTATGNLQQPRVGHAMLHLPNGEVFVVGGAGKTTERYDPNTGTFSASADMLQDRGRTAAQLLSSGKVLVVSGTSAELYDPETDTFEGLQGPGASYLTPRLVALPSGKALLTGSITLSAELFDPKTKSFSFTGADSLGRIDTELVLLPRGLPMDVGGRSTTGTSPAIYTQGSLLHELGNGAKGVFDDATNMAFSRTAFASAVLHDGSLLVTGGDSCLGGCPEQRPFEAERWRDGADPTLRPVISDAPASVTPGTEVTITGTNLLGPERSGGAHNASPTNHPTVAWQPLGRRAIVTGDVTSFSDTTLVWRVPATSHYGPGWLHINVGGVVSVGRAVTITVAPDATGCDNDAECNSGFCTDGVCCDTRCGDRCQACTADLKGSGGDGVCGPVPPERDADDDCVLSSGAPCDNGTQCDTGFCVDGLCCDGDCTGQCEACDVEGSEGQCVPVTGAPHGGRAACDATPPEDACAAQICDGTERTTCAGTIGPCDPYACAIDGCLTSCGDNGDCATGFHCDEGACVAGQCNGTIATTPDGTEIDCAPFTCQPDGSCRTSCADVSDCAEPFACNFEGVCVQRPPNDVPSDCACRAVGAAGSDTRPVWVVLAILGFVGLRRRRREALGMLVIAATVALATPGYAQEEETPAEQEAPAEAAPRESDVEKQKAEALEHFRKGIMLVEQQAWRPALAEFLQSRKIFPTRVATSNAAVCYEKLQRFDDALEMQEALLEEFVESLNERQKSEAQVAVIRLRKLVGTIDIDGAEPGSAIVIDGAHRGTYPPPSPLRAPAGTHLVRVYKEGFEPFEARVDLAGGATAQVEAKLVALRATGLLKVVEAKGLEIEVLVDGVGVGKTPWEGRVAPGQHAVRLHGDGRMGTAPVQAPVKAGETTALSLEAKLLDAMLRIEPTPANAQVSLDSVVLGRGVWEGAVPAGAHRVEVLAEGFFTAKRSVEVKSGGHRDVAVSLERNDDADVWTVPGKFTFDAVGAATLVPTFGGDVSSGCDGDCSAGIGIGGYAKLNVGYELPNGFGFGVMGGYLAMTQDVEGRDTLVQPVGLSRRPGTASDKLSLNGPVVGAFASYLFDMEFPLLVRLAVGPAFTTVRDERTSSFPVDEGGAYQAGPIAQEPSAIFLLIDPEVRLNVKLGEHVHVGIGLDIPVMVALQLPVWDASREIDAAEDGIGAFGSESLTGRVVVGLSPNVGLRAHF